MIGAGRGCTHGKCRIFKDLFVGPNPPVKGLRFAPSEVGLYTCTTKFGSQLNIGDIFVTLFCICIDTSAITLAYKCYVIMPNIGVLVNALYVVLRMINVTRQMQ